MTQRILSTLTLCWVILAGLTVAGAADPQPVADPRPIAEISLSSVDRVDGAFKKAGFNGYRKLILGVVEDFPFTGPGSIDTAKPLAMHFLGGDALKDEQQALFMIPVKPGIATIADLVKTGNWQPAPGKADTVLAANGFGLRRTQDYILFGGLPDFLTKPQDAVLAAEYADLNLLAVAKVDVAALKAAAPKKFAAFIDGIAQPRDNAKPGELAGEKWVQDIARDKVDTLAFALAATDRTLSLKTVVTPADLKPAAANYQRPQFPAAGIGEAHVLINAAELLPSLKAGLMLAWQFGGGGADGENPADVRAAIDAAIEFLGGDAISLSAQEIDGHLVVFAVIQGARDRNVEAELDKLDQAVAAAAKAEKGGKVWDRSTYKDANQQAVSRLAIFDGGKNVGYADFASRGHALIAAFAADGGHYVERISDLKFAGDLSRLATAEVDVARVRKALASAGVVKADALPPGILDAGKVTLNVSVADRALTVELIVPRTYLGDMVKLSPFK